MNKCFFALEGVEAAEEMLDETIEVAETTSTQDLTLKCEDDDDDITDVEDADELDETEEGSIIETAFWLT